VLQDSIPESSKIHSWWYFW